MPKFDLSSNERRQIVASLTTSETPSEYNLEVAPGTDAIDRGRKLVEASNCAACHRIPGIRSRELPALVSKSIDQPDDCFVPHKEDAPHVTNEARRPSFAHLNGSRADAILAWFSRKHADRQLGADAQGKLLLDRNGCVACHDRDADLGLSQLAGKLQKSHPDLNGQSEAMIPPSLTAAGDRIRDDYLKAAVAGEQKSRRLPWLHVRMPKFRHSDVERAAIVHHLKTADRIPDEADGARADILAKLDLFRKPATPEELLLGNTLTGAAGFNCVACHKAGEFEPRNVALGTRGSDIMTMGDRIRPRFFQRWMKNPIRVVAGIEMPAIKKGIPTILDGHLPSQITAVWKALSDKNFTPPTVTSRFEQVVNVAPGERPRIIRDVFTIGTNSKTFAPVARALAVGFGNKHNLLVDLDQMKIRQWTIGEFARQRTEGKSWYWDMPGTAIQMKNHFRHKVVFQYDEKAVTPVEDEGRLTETLNYRTKSDGVEVVSRMWFDFSGKPLPVPPAEPHLAVTAWRDPNRPLQSVILRHQFRQSVFDGWQGWVHDIEIIEAPDQFDLAFKTESIERKASQIKVRTQHQDRNKTENGRRIRGVEISAFAELAVAEVSPPATKPSPKQNQQAVTSTPGLDGIRLPLETSIMPTAMTWLPDGRMAFTSLKGHVWIAKDTDGDRIPDQQTMFEEGLAAPFGILADGDSLIVSHKPEVVRLRDTDGDGRADVREVIASGWGFNDNYHDWASGLIRDGKGNMYLGLGSDYSQKNRPPNQDRWRGGVIKIDPSGNVIPLGMSMRYPMSIAMDRFGNIFATDNQGVQNTFNEINHILPNRHYGVPSRHQPTDDIKNETPAIMVPHPWTRSVNSILFLPGNYPVAALRGHGIGCEYDSRFLIRFTVQNVRGTLQGASYRFSKPNLDDEAGKSNFIGPICSAISPNGELFIGSIWDSGWQGGQNNGGITRLVPSAAGLPNGIRELRATRAGFEVEFFRPVDRNIAADASNWSLQGYTRKWGGSYGTPDSGRYSLTPKRLFVSPDGRTVSILVSDLRAGFMYDVVAKKALADKHELWPSEAHYSMKVVPK